MDGAMTLLTLSQAQQCRDLIILAAHLQDSRDLAAFAACFAQDGVLVRPGGEPLSGPAAIEAAYRARDPQRITQHLVMNQRVESLGRDASGALQARVHSKVLLWSSHDSQELTPKGRQADPIQQIGEFEDTLICREDQWRIGKRRASFVLFSEA
jgi:SnoaL-like domain